jgi:ribosomal protein S18 acetylase RimI-like enzyme
MSDIIYRIATKDDIPQIADLMLALNKTQGDDTRPAESALLEHLDRDYDAYIAEKNERAVAACLGTKMFLPHMGLSRYDVMAIHVLDEFRRLGIAKELMKFTVKDQYDRGLRFFILQVLATNTSARRFYKKIGFAERDANFHRCVLAGSDLENYIENSNG